MEALQQEVTDLRSKLDKLESMLASNHNITHAALLALSDKLTLLTTPQTKSTTQQEQETQDQINQTQDQTSQDQMSQDQMSQDQMSPDQMSQDQVSQDQISQDQITQDLPATTLAPIAWDVHHPTQSIICKYSRFSI